MMENASSNANDIVEASLNDLIVELEKGFGTDVLSFSGRLAFGADDAIRDAVEWRKSQKPSKPRLSFFLETEGGYIEVAQRIATTLRKHYRRVEFVIPNAAMSAGTVLAMCGDAIHMDYYSTLGPIDPQLPRPDGTGYVPAMGYLKKFDELMKKAADGGLTTAETTYLCTKFDPAELYQYRHAMQLSVFLLEQWLARYKFRNWKRTQTRGIRVTPTMRRQRAHEIAEKLNDTEKWHTHGHGISMAVLRRDLKLQIEDFGKDRERWRLIRRYWDLLTDYRSKIGGKGMMHTRNRYRLLVWSAR
jgi:hypothetical protein